MADEVVTDAVETEAEAEDQGELDPATKLTEAEELANKNWDLYVRSQAELENYRKRAQRDRQDLLKFGNENILRELLPVIDNLDRACPRDRR